MVTSHGHRLAAAASWRGLASRWLVATLALTAGQAAAWAAVLSRPAASPEYAVKSAFLYNFATFVEWPAGAPSASAPQLTICVLGADPFGESLDQVVAGKTIGARPLAIKRVSRVSEAADCAVVFVGAGEGLRLPSLFADLRGLPVLTVGDADGFAEAGGIIGMFVENNRVRFEINLGAAEKARLKISSKLLSLARIVGTRRSEGR
jgi:hypothetical protein